MTHKERAERRKLIARQVADRGGGPKAQAEVATLHDVGLEMVRSACKAAGDETSGVRGPVTGSRTLRLLAEMLTTEDSLSTIAKRHRVAVSWLSELCTAARAAGIPIAEQTYGGKVRRDE